MLTETSFRHWFRRFFEAVGWGVVISLFLTEHRLTQIFFAVFVACGYLVLLNTKFTTQEELANEKVVRGIYKFGFVVWIMMPVFWWITITNLINTETLDTPTKGEQTNEAQSRPSS